MLGKVSINFGKFWGQIVVDVKAHERVKTCRPQKHIEGWSTAGPVCINNLTFFT